VNQRRRDLVLDGATIVALASQDVIADGELIITGDTIAHVGARGGRRRPDSEVIDCSDRIILPGLINAHVHSEYILLKGLVEDRRLREWEETDAYNRAWSWVRDPSNVEHVRHAYRASYLTGLRGGTTFVGEFNCADAATPASIEAAEETGIRAIPTLDLGRREAFPAVEKRGCLHSIDDEEGLTEDELNLAAELLTNGDDVRLTMHAAETAERMVLIRARLGRTTIDLLDAHGLLGPHLLLSHAIHVTPQEIERIAQTRTRVVTSPVAEMKLSDGVGPVAEMLARGVPVSLGTDAAVCNNGNDMFREMKTAALLQKVTKGAHVVTAVQALVMATLNGARAFGRSAELGTIENGKLADLVLVDARSAAMTPLIHNGRHSNVLANLVHCATAADVTDVLVGGEWMIRDRRHVRLDEAQVLRQLQSSADELHRTLH